MNKNSKRRLKLALKNYHSTVAKLDPKWSRTVTFFIGDRQQAITIGQCKRLSTKPKVGAR